MLLLFHVSILKHHNINKTKKLPFLYKISRNMANFANFNWGGEDACIAILRHNFDYNQSQRPKHFDIGFPCGTRLAK